MINIEKNFEFQHLDDEIKKAYQDLRRNIQYCSIGNRLKTITITSCMYGEGKSTTAINLAVYMADSGLKVLLIDADLRKPACSEEQTHNCMVGLSNLLAGHTPWEDAIHTTNIDKLHVMCCGTVASNPLLLINSVDLRALLSTYSDLYDIILIDTPPVGIVIDGTIIAAQTDGVILVIEYNTVNYTNVLKVKEQLEQLNAKILGVVLNKMKKREYKSFFKCKNIANKFHFIKNLINLKGRIR